MIRHEKIFGNPLDHFPCFFLFSPPALAAEPLLWDYEDGTLTVSGSGDMNFASSPPWAELKKEIRAVIIQPGITSIGDDAFSGCENLETVSIPHGVTSIGNRAFYFCRGLTAVNIPEGVT